MSLGQLPPLPLRGEIRGLSLGLSKATVGLRIEEVQTGQAVYRLSSFNQLVQGSNPPFQAILWRLVFSV
jgi:hypothetical protein